MEDFRNMKNAPIDNKKPYITIEFKDENINIEAFNYRGTRKNCTGIKATEPIEKIFEEASSRTYKDDEKKEPSLYQSNRAKNHLHLD